MKFQGTHETSQEIGDTPNLLYAALERTACVPFFKERRMKFQGTHETSQEIGVWGTHHLLEERIRGREKRMC
jgi:hypothetical protein